MNRRRQNADKRAEELVGATPRINELLGKLKEEAGKIRDQDERSVALLFLDRPSFQVIRGRKRAEADIVAKLHAEGLLSPEMTTLFPEGTPMRFAASSGGVWNGHHAYPGGLVYHTSVNLRIGLAMAAVYRDVYGIDLDEDAIRLCALMHDAAKTLTIHWNKDGSAVGEPTIAGTAAHHILMVSEALYRGWPSRLVVILASAHSPPHAGVELENLLRFLRAAAIISGKPYEAAGLNPDGKALARTAPIEAFINHVDDHDFVFTETSMKAVAQDLDRDLNTPGDYWKRNEILSGQSDIPLYLRILKHSSQ